jgi:hypothetical protein
MPSSPSPSIALAAKPRPAPAEAPAAARSERAALFASARVRPPSMAPSAAKPIGRSQASSTMGLPVPTSSQPSKRAAATPISTPAPAPPAVRNALVTEIQDRLIDLYVQQDEARGEQDPDRARELQVEIDKATAHREEIRPWAPS